MRVPRWVTPLMGVVETLPISRTSPWPAIWLPLSASQESGCGVQDQDPPLRFAPQPENCETGVQM
ncbi:hypothetical protein CFK38_13495 [Brachybacterium vulturis]|uniref:Uncharacterized protein n=1 Tax=Brachybacterium vulturis TaxID=2017484 RepID=A0A291GQN7_9MICO|nr:hypothetical protein CFK38_13495 [Brachybacterium vulturis]